MRTSTCLVRFRRHVGRTTPERVRLRERPYSGRQCCGGRTRHCPRQVSALRVDPDSGQGPTTLVVLDSGKLVNLGNPDNSPTFLAAVGDTERTCAVEMPLRDCPAASMVYDRLKGESIPLGFGMENPADILVFHAPTYYLEFSDGQANHNRWRFYGMNHPLQRVIDESLESLQACMAPALDAYKGAN